MTDQDIRYRLVPVGGGGGGGGGVPIAAGDRVDDLDLLEDVLRAALGDALFERARELRAAGKGFEVRRSAGGAVPVERDPPMQYVVLRTSPARQPEVVVDEHRLVGVDLALDVPSTSPTPSEQRRREAENLAQLRARGRRRRRP